MSTRCFFIVSTHICHDCPGTDEWSGCFHDVPTGQEAIASAATVEAEHWDANRKRHWNKVSNTSNWQIKSPHCCNGQVVGNDERSVLGEVPDPSPDAWMLVLGPVDLEHDDEVGHEVRQGHPDERTGVGQAALDDTW